jgi:succinyl-diaminopimelate desuccinylase
MPINVTDFALELISKKSISGEKDEGAIELLNLTLSRLGFDCEIVTFSGDGSYEVANLYAQYNKSGSGLNLCFAGHTDVVPAGDLSLWSVEPFTPKIVDGFLIGRGAVDMKGSIACWVYAVSEFLEENKKFSKGCLSFLITGDEEADSINGTVKLLDHISKKNIKLNSCIVGEPTNTDYVGDMMKIGRRGSISFTLKVNGLQGHVAYPEKVINPNSIIIKILNELISTKLDNGNEFFQASNLEVTSIDVNNSATNVVPQSATAKFNIRFNNIHTTSKIKDFVDLVCKKHSQNFELTTRKGACEAFLSKPQKLAELVLESAQEVTRKTPVKSTTGGTSDARFIKDYCEVVEFGLINSTAHKIDEKIKVSELEDLKNIYKKIIEKYFA